MIAHARQPVDGGPPPLKFRLAVALPHPRTEKGPHPLALRLSAAQVILGQRSFRRIGRSMMGGRRCVIRVRLRMCSSGSESGCIQRSRSRLRGRSLGGGWVRVELTSPIFLRWRLRSGWTSTRSCVSRRLRRALPRKLVETAGCSVRDLDSLSERELERFMVDLAKLVSMDDTVLAVLVEQVLAGDEPVSSL